MPPRRSPFAQCRFFYASSACIYPEGKQLNTEVEGGGLKEADAWPAQPQDAYGLEKLASEEIAKHYDSDFGMECRIARFHNIYGPYGTWKGGREKAPAAFCRKAICAQVCLLLCCASLGLVHMLREGWRGWPCELAGGLHRPTGCHDRIKATCHACMACICVSGVQTGATMAFTPVHPVGALRHRQVVVQERGKTVHVHTCTCQTCLNFMRVKGVGGAGRGRDVG